MSSISLSPPAAQAAPRTAPGAGGASAPELARPALPLDFAPACPAVDSRRAARLGGALAELWAALDAHGAGHPPPDAADEAPPAAQLHPGARAVLAELIAPDSPFWTRLAGYLAAHARSRRRTIRFVQHPGGAADPDAEIREIAEEIAAPRLAVAAGLVALQGDETHFGALAAAILEYELALRHFVDVRDWKRHLARGEPSLLLARIHVAGTPVYGGPPPAPEVLAREIYYGGHATRCLEHATAHLDRAAGAAAGLASDGWLRHLRFCRERIASAAGDLRALVARNRAAVRISPVALPEPAADSVHWRLLRHAGAAYLAAEARRGFGEVRHLMRVTSLDDGERTELYACDVFQRAVVADVLCDLDAVIGGGLLRQAIRQEADYLAGCRLRHGIGGWNYCPAWTDLPPDADDVGQVMQVLARTGNHDAIREGADEALRVLFGECAHGDGSFDTWIIPRDDDGPLYDRQRRRVQHAGKLAPTPEVVANLVYGLLLHDEARYHTQIERGLSAIEGMQRPDGSWSSEWYAGPFYGTWACVRALAARRPASPALRRALDFVRGTQAADGSWPRTRGGDDGNPLDTALALLALAAGHAPGPVPADVRAQADAGARYLLGCRDGEGWPAFDWLNVPYGSRTITTAYVAKAAAAWEVRWDLT